MMMIMMMMVMLMMMMPTSVLDVVREESLTDVSHPSSSFQYFPSRLQIKSYFILIVELATNDISDTVLQNDLNQALSCSVPSDACSVGCLLTIHS